MDHLEVPQLLGLLALMLGVAKLCGAAVKLVGQPSVLGELVAGIALGMSAAGFVDPHNEVLHVLAELGVVILLFEIGLETDLRALLRVGPASGVVAIAGVVLPFAFGYAVCHWLGLNYLTSILAGATLTATSVGITARVLSDLNRLQDQESQIILGAAIVDDVIGLVILGVVSGLTEGVAVTFVGVVQKTAVAFGFLLVTVLVGQWIVPRWMRWISRIDMPGTPTIVAVIIAFLLAWAAFEAGSAMIIGAFAAGILIRGTVHAHEIERGVAHLGHFFVPLFFVVVGASVDLRVLNPLVAENHRTLMIGGLLIVVAIAGKMLAGYTPFWFKGKKTVIGVGMVPRGEVGLIFAQMGLATGVFDASLFGAVMLMVMVTTLIAPPLLRAIFPPRPSLGRPRSPEGIEELVAE